MGTDIHIVCERQAADGSWGLFTPPIPSTIRPDARDSEVFAYFGVGRMRDRTLAVAPFAGRGLPLDHAAIDTYPAIIYGEYMGDYGHTWATGEELAAWFTDDMAPSHLRDFSQWLARTYPGTRVLMGFDS